LSWASAGGRSSVTGMDNPSCAGFSPRVSVENPPFEGITVRCQVCRWDRGRRVVGFGAQLRPRFTTRGFEGQPNATTRREAAWAARVGCRGGERNRRSVQLCFPALGVGADRAGVLPTDLRRGSLAGADDHPHIGQKSRISLVCQANRAQHADAGGGSRRSDGDAAVLPRERAQPATDRGRPARSCEHRGLPPASGRPPHRARPSPRRPAAEDRRSACRIRCPEIDNGSPA
jgi:hypothetical protein